jgi:GNAT superfamily N-acetyltransferase
MINLRQGTEADAQQLAPLILASAPELMAFLFGSSAKAIEYLRKACEMSDGQYSAMRHFLACVDGEVLGSMSLWHHQMPESFQLGTLDSLTRHLSPDDISHIVKVNDVLQSVFKPPNMDEVCLGHFAVKQQWQGQEIGTKLMDYAISQGHRYEKQHIVLDVDESNHVAIAFYRKWDFTVQDSTLFAPTQQRFLRMVKALH